MAEGFPPCPSLIRGLQGRLIGAPCIDCHHAEMAHNFDTGVCDICRLLRDIEVEVKQFVEGLVHG